MGGSWDILLFPSSLKVLSAGAAEEATIFSHHVESGFDKKAFLNVIQRLIEEGYVARDRDDGEKLRFVSPVLKDWWAYTERGL